MEMRMPWGWTGAFIMLAGCTGGAGSLSDWSAGYEQGVDTGPSESSDPIGFSIIVPYDAGYDVRLSDDSGAEGCALDVPDSFVNAVSTTCTYDVSELDLYGAGLTFEVYVPDGACDFLVYDFYMYEAWESGDGPEDVGYTIDKNGVITDPVNFVNGSPYCEYDHQRVDPDYPNCCTGNYTLTVTDQASGTVSTETRSWDGDLAACYDGAAFAYPGVTLDAAGFPMGTIVALDEARYSKRFAWGSVADRYFTNVVLANHYDPADHDGGPPAGLQGEYAQPTYRFRCYDHAAELKAQIDMVVREWNEESEFYAGGDPDTDGVEASAGGPIDDLLDWATATPGANNYIGDND